MIKDIDQVDLKKYDLVYFVIDCSGSFLDINKEEIKKLITNVNYKTNVSCETRVVTHTTVANRKILSVEEFIKDTIFSGGTYLSKGLVRAFGDYYEESFNCDTGGMTTPETLIIQITDGENWCEDNPRFFKAIERVSTGLDYVYIEVANNMVETFMDKYKNDLNSHDFYYLRTTTKDLSGYFTNGIYGIEHKVNGDLYYFIAGHNNLNLNDMVVCDTKKGLVYGRIKKKLKNNSELPQSINRKDLKKCWRAND